ncbi:MAG TPA: hypothetical protein PLJ35_10530, partial [Anaerolineae bacterium]|nr:hypothetical protein [Anaerolineae bacterium]
AAARHVQAQKLLLSLRGGGSCGARTADEAISYARRGDCFVGCGLLAMTNGKFLDSRSEAISNVAVTRMAGDCFAAARNDRLSSDDLAT